MRSAQRPRPLLAPLYIGSVNKLDDLRDGQRALPEPYPAYDVHLIDWPLLALTVRYSVRATEVN